MFAAALTGADGAQTMQAAAAAPPPVPPSVAPYREHDGAANEPVGASAAVPPLAVSGGVPDPAEPAAWPAPARCVACVRIR